MNSKLFEAIYETSNSAAETENTYLESPLDTELKPPMLMEEIYFECNVRHLQEMVTVESGRIYISEIEESKTMTDIKVLKKYYYNYVLQKMKYDETWKEVGVENTKPTLKIKINKRCLDHWYHDSNKRKQIIAVQALPYFIQKMKNITPELNQKLNKENIEYLYKAECPNVTIEGIDGKTTHTIKLTIVKWYGAEHQTYSWYVNNLLIE